jgi:hypothetical protein
MSDSNQLEILVNLIRSDRVKFIVGIEKDGERYFMKSACSAPIIGHFYRAALKQERPGELTSKLLPFPDFGECFNNR